MTEPRAIGDYEFRPLTDHAAATAAIERLQERVAEIEVAFNSACAFIDSHAADPDINDRMVVAYAEFTKQRKQIKAIDSAIAADAERGG